MQSGARVKVLKTQERMKGVAPLYSAWKSANFRNVFKSRSDILQLFGIEITTEFFFVGMAASPMRARFNPFDCG